MTAPESQPVPEDSAEPTRRPGRAQKLVDQVFGQLRENILSGELATGSRLPGEMDLAVRLGVSRPIVREALKRLREAGLVYSRQGSGSYVKVQDERPEVLGFNAVRSIADIQRCYEFRLTIEPEAAAFAALRRDDRILQKIRAALNEMRDASRDPAQHAYSNFLFHRLIADASNNHYYGSCLDALREHIEIGMTFHRGTLTGPTAKVERIFEEHGQIYDAIAEGDDAKARTLMRSHLEASRDLLFEGRVLDLTI